MKQIILALFIVFEFANFEIYGQSISVEDTRIINSPPTSYGHNVKFEFKDRGTIGVPGIGSYSGMFTFAPWSDNTGNKHHQLNFNDGGIFYRNGWPSSDSWGQWRTVLMENENGNVGIGTINPEAKLTVKGKIVASEIQVKDVGAIPDYVFKPDYELMPLRHVEEFVKKNLHLPEVPSEQEFKENGINMAEMNALLLKKIEELTLYSIDQNNKLNKHAEKIEALEKAMNISSTK